MKGLVAFLLIGFVWLFRRLVQKQLMSFAESSGMLATTPEEIFEHNLKVYMSMGEKDNAVALLHSAIVQKVIKGEQPRKVDVERIKDLNGLELAGEEDRLVCPDAIYKLEIVRGVIFIRADLSVARYKNYDSEVKEVLLRILESKRLEKSDRELLEKFNCYIGKSEKRGEIYGGPGFPYPDERYYVMERLNGKRITFAFDDNFNLLVAMDYSDTSKDVVVWERSGARKPEFY